MIVTKRDLRILWVCHHQKFMTLLQIAKMFFPESRDILHRPMKRVCALVQAGYLKAYMLNILGQRLYVVTREGGRLLKQHQLMDGLRIVEGIETGSLSHDLLITDVRIIFQCLLGVKKWISERTLKKEKRNGKVPDGIMIHDEIRYIVEVERTLKAKRIYERILTNMCVTDYPDAVILYLVGNETDKAWLMRQAEAWERIYFTTLSAFMDLGSSAQFENSKGHVIEFDRVYQGGPHFNDRDILVLDGDDGLAEFRKDDEEYLQFQKEDREQSKQFGRHCLPNDDEKIPQTPSAEFEIDKG